MVVVEQVLKQLNDASEDPIHGPRIVSEALDTLTNVSGIIMELACGELAYIRDQLEEYIKTHNNTILLDCISELEIFDNTSMEVFSD